MRGVRAHGHHPPRYALRRIIAHRSLHIGGIELKRRQSGTPVAAARAQIDHGTHARQRSLF